MKLKIRSFPDAGVADKERVVIKATTNVDVGQYVLFCSRKSPDSNGTSGRQQSMYWFADQQINAGELVVLYTKAGKRSQKKLSSGATAHFFYWGLSAPIWGDGSNVAVLMEASDWDTSVPQANGG